MNRARPSGEHARNEDDSTMTEAEQHENALASMSPANRAAFDRTVREMRDQAGLTTEAERRHCVYCGTAADLEVINPVTGDKACRVTELCELRCQGTDPVELALRLARGLAKLARHDTEARHALGQPGSPEQAAYQPALSGTDLARLHLVFAAAGSQINGSNRAEWSRLLTQARADLGCRTCGAIGLENCTTVTGCTRVPRTHGTWGPRWHAGRTL